MTEPEKINSEKVLAAIRQMVGRQKFSPQPISLDTLTLVLNISQQELLPLIEELRLTRDIVFHPPATSSSARTKRNGSVSLT